MRREEHDPYSPPPRHKERSGGVVRLAVIAALLGAAAWGYMEYSQQPQTALVQPAAEEQDFAQNQAPVAPPAQPASPAAEPGAATPVPSAGDTVDPPA